MTDRSEGHGRPAGPDVCTLLLLLPFKATAIALFSALGSGESWVSCREIRGALDKDHKV